MTLAGTLIGAMPTGKLADNVLYFVRVLRAAGLPVGPAKVLDALAAVEAVGVANRADFREALAAVLVSRREHAEIFEQAFDWFWRNPRLLERMLAALLPKIQGRTQNVSRGGLCAHLAVEAVWNEPAGTDRPVHELH